MTQHRIFGPESSPSSEIDFGAVLGGLEYQFALQWIGVGEFWAITITDTRRQTVLASLRVVGNTDMLQPFNDMPRLPPGKLVAYDTTGMQSDPGREDWLERHLLIYEDPIEVVPENFIRVTPIAVAE